MAVENRLRFYRLDTGEILRTRTERAQKEAERAQQETKRAQHESNRAQQEAERADREAAARQAAEAEIARLRKELGRRASPEAS